MSYENKVAAVLLDQIRDSADELDREAGGLRFEGGTTGPSDVDLERADFRTAAAAGARRYAETLQAQIAAGEVTDTVLEQAHLVATAAECAGWIGTAGVVVDRDAALEGLLAAGVFALYPQVPGHYVACYRLVAPC